MSDMMISDMARGIYDELACGWNTWDVRSVAAHVFLPDRLRLHVSFVIPARSGYTEDSLWNHVENFGEHSDDGRYTSVDIAYLEGRWRIETSARGDELLVRVTPLNERAGAYVVLEVSPIWGGQIDIAHAPDGTITAQGCENHFTVRALNAPTKLAWNPARAANLAVGAGDVAYFTVNSKKLPAEIDAAISDGLSQWMAETIRADGGLGEGLDAMRRSLLWNMVFEPRNRRVITPVSRNWCQRRGVHFGDYVLFDWDTFFASLQYALIDKKLAYACFFSMIEELTPEGMIPNFGCATGQSRDRSEPQVGALCAWKLYRQFGDADFIAAVFDPLLTWNRWRFRERDKNGDGLLELGSTPYDGTDDEMKANGFGSMDKQAAMFESGLDNSTMFDRAVWNAEKCCLEQSYVGLNALMVADCDLLIKMARLLNRSAEAEELKTRRDALAQKMDAALWCEEKGTYLNRNWDGTFDETLSLTHFYPMLGGLPADRQERLMRHLVDENEFWGAYVIPNIARCDPSFQDQEYWRGRIWGPTNFLVGEGLLRMNELHVWDELARKGLELFLGCWRTRGIVGENYNAITGEAAENKSSDRFYHWGALLVYMAVARAVDFNAWQDEIVRRSPPDWLDDIYRIPVGAIKMDVRRG